MENIKNVEASPSETKRKRATNWIEEDKMLLQQLLKERVSVIENKNTDTNSNNKKKKAWMELEESFNNMCNGSKRTLAQLKSQWIVTKIHAKKQVSNHRREVMKTGGGPQPPQLEISEDDIAAWLPNEFVVDTNQFDSDGVYDISLAKTSQIGTDESPADTNTSLAESRNVADDVHIIEERAVPTKPTKKMKATVNQDVADEKIKEVVRFDLQCREELHRLQVLNEEKRSQHYNLKVLNEEKKSRNLDLEYEILEEKRKSQASKEYF